LVCAQNYQSNVKKLVLGDKGNVTIVLRECYEQAKECGLVVFIFAQHLGQTQSNP